MDDWAAVGERHATTSNSQFSRDDHFSCDKLAASSVAASLCICILLCSTLAQADAESLAEVDGEAITASDIKASIGAPLSKLEEQIYALKRRALDALISEKLVAKEAERRQMSPEALLQAETRSVERVTELEVELVYRARKGQGNLDEGAAVSRVVTNVEGAPYKGGSHAAVTIVEFQDFHCPYCRRVQPTRTQLATRYGDRLRLVYRDFPIDSLHPQARKAHEAARCANDQGRFWPYHDALYAKPPVAGIDDLNAIAGEAGIDLQTFERCMAAGTYRSAVQKDIDEGMRLGVVGTPTFFINGRVISGAQPFETFARIVDEELARSN